MTPSEIAIAALTAIFADFDAETASALLAPDYIQHNPAMPTGAAPVLGMIPALKDSGISFETVRVVSEGDMVVLHNVYNNAQAFGAEQMVAFDVFRIEDGKVAEHWDNLAPLTPPNPSGHTQTDGATEITDLDKTAENKALVEGFINTILVKGEFDKVTDYISTETYIQHNSQIGDGLDGLNAALAAMAEKGVTMTYSDLHFSVAEGNFVLTASEGEFAGAHSAFYDLFRVENGKIVEHWDIISPIPEEAANENGKF